MKNCLKTLLLFLFTLELFAQSELSTVNFSDLSVNKLIEISSKVLNKNIVSTEPIEGKVDFVSHAPINQAQLLEVLMTVLNAKGYTVEDNGTLLKIKKMDDVSEVSQKEEQFLEIMILKNAEAKSVLPIIQEIFNHKSYAKNQPKPLISQDAETNAIIVYASKKDTQHIEKLIENLDKHRLQVYVEAKIIELSENKTKNLGIKYGLSAASATSSNIFTLGANLGGVVNALDASTSALFTIPTQTLTSAVALGATLNILKTNQAIDIVSEPSVLCVNNKESSIYVGETKSFQTGLSVTDGGKTNTTFQREDIGLTLKVKPRISSDNKVILEIETILEDAKELQLNQTNPDTTKKEVKTTAIVNNGESVILGGLIKSKNDVLNTKTPFLGDIPLLGELFKHTKDVQDKVNLVVIMTPYIIPQSKDLTFIREQLFQLKNLEEQYTTRLEERLTNNIKKNSTTQESPKDIPSHDEILKGRY
ncbi:MAG: secretin N-terminal domain-containing protein [Arcobacteraceae bacterium]